MHRLLAIGVAALWAVVSCGIAAAWSWPADGQVLRPFTLGADAYAAGQHRGIDVAGADGSPVRAPAAGTVTFAGSLPTYGRGVTIVTAGGYAVTLVHLGTVSVAKGDSVSEGATIGTIGWSGDAEHDVPSVHLGIRVASQSEGYVDPLGLLPPRAVAAVPVASPATAPSSAPVAAAPPATVPAPPAPPASPAPPTAPSPPVTAAATSSSPAPNAQVTVPSTAPEPAPPSADPAATRPDAVPGIEVTTAREAASSRPVTRPPSTAATLGSDRGAPDVGHAAVLPTATVEDRAPLRTAVEVIPATDERASTGSIAAAAAVDGGLADRPGGVAGDRSLAAGMAGGRAPFVRPDAGLAHVGAVSTHPGAPPGRHVAAELASPSSPRRADVRPPSVERWWAGVSPLALPALLAGVAALGACLLARRIGRDGAVLPDDADLLRQLDPAHRPRVHDHRRGRVRASPAAARS